MCVWLAVIRHSRTSRLETLTRLWRVCVCECVCVSPTPPPPPRHAHFRLFHMWRSSGLGGGWRAPGQTVNSTQPSGIALRQMSCNDWETQGSSPARTVSLPCSHTRTHTRVVKSLNLRRRREARNLGSHRSLPLFFSPCASSPLIMRSIF